MKYGTRVRMVMGNKPEYYPYPRYRWIGTVVTWSNEEYRKDPNNKLEVEFAKISSQREHASDYKSTPYAIKFLEEIPEDEFQTQILLES